MKKPTDSATQQVHKLRYQYLNGQRRLFGGVLMQWIDELAGIVGNRHSGRNVITASVDSLVFKQPAYLEDLIVMNGRVTYVGKTSMEVRVDTYAEDFAGNRRLINTAYLVMVATSDDGQPVPVPALAPQTDEEKQEWAMAEKRYALRKERREKQY